MPFLYPQSPFGAIILKLDFIIDLCVYLANLRTGIPFWEKAGVFVIFSRNRGNYNYYNNIGAL